MADMVTHRINGALKKRVLDRLGLTEGNVDIREERWDFGAGCPTCSYPEEGFSVHVNGELVWPSDEYLSDFGGVYFADTDGRVSGSTLTIYGQFNNWLNNQPWDDIE